MANMSIVVIWAAEVAVGKGRWQVLSESYVGTVLSSSQCVAASFAVYSKAPGSKHRVTINLRKNRVKRIGTTFVVLVL